MVCSGIVTIESHDRTIRDAYRCEDGRHSLFDRIAETQRQNHLDTVTSGYEKYLLVLSVVEGYGAATSRTVVESKAKPESSVNEESEFQLESKYLRQCIVNTFKSTFICLIV